MPDFIPMDLRTSDMDNHAEICLSDCTDELKQRLIHASRILDQDIIDTNGVEDFKHALVQRRVIMNTSCAFHTHSDHIWLVLCDWFA